MSRRSRSVSQSRSRGSSQSSGSSRRSSSSRKSRQGSFDNTPSDAVFLWMNQSIISTIVLEALRHDSKKAGKTCRWALRFVIDNPFQYWKDGEMRVCSGVRASFKPKKNNGTGHLELKPVDVKAGHASRRALAEFAFPVLFEDVKVRDIIDLAPEGEKTQPNKNKGGKCQALTAEWFMECYLNGFVDCEPNSWTPAEAIKEGESFRSILIGWPKSSKPDRPQKASKGGFSDALIKELDAYIMNNPTPEAIADLQKLLTIAWEGMQAQAAAETAHLFAEPVYFSSKPDAIPVSWAHGGASRRDGSHTEDWGGQNVEVGNYWDHTY